MHGKLGVPYRFLYSSKNYVPGLANIVAKVKKPDNTTVGVYTLIEVPDVDFAGSYYFDLIINQLMPEGEYIVIIKELTSGFRQVSKVTMTKPDGEVDNSKIDITGKIVKDDRVSGAVESNAELSGVISDIKISGKLIVPVDIKAEIYDGIVYGSISQYDVINGILKEVC